ncbi:MAG: NDP-sugar synthase [Candidatus Altiarchaeota archaeon]|nr:NDP-sugar synthase [Candidatus Altiarchaeota archaeon]
MKAVILAGGMGTRMRPLTYTTTKPMIPFLNKPVIDHIVTKLARQGFKEVILTTNYMPEVIEEYFGDGEKWGVEFKTVMEDEPLGTAGSVRNALHHLDETFAVIQGDNISEIDIAKLYKDHKKMGGLLTICLMEVKDVSLFGIAEMRDDEITAYKEKPEPEEVFSNLANTGIYIIEPEVLDMIPLSFYDFSKNLFPKMLKERKKICGSVTHSFWRDVGTPRDYMEATQYFLKGNNLLAPGAAVDGKVHKSVLGRDSRVSGELDSSVLFERVVVEKGAVVEESLIGSGTVVKKGAQIGPSCVIGDNVIIEEGAIVLSNSRIGPNITVGSHNKVGGLLVPDEFKDI